MDVLKVILVAFICSSQARDECGEPGYIQCRTNTNQCIPYIYLCDRDDDCGDGSDESEEICEFIRSLPDSHCGDKRIPCNDECLELQQFCECADIENKDPRVCQMFTDNQIQIFRDIVVPEEEYPGDALEKAKEMAEVFRSQIDVSIVDSNDACPELFTLIDGRCLSFPLLAQHNWVQARAFCLAIGGDLLTISDGVTQFESLVTHMRSLDVEADFWLGGVLEDEETGWEWVDGSAFQTGTPFWAIRYETRCNRYRYPNLNRTADRDGGCYLQGPHEPVVGHCLALTHDKYYYFSDEECRDKKNPLCVAIANEV